MSSGVQSDLLVLVSTWSEENIQEWLKSCTRKKPIWKEVSAFLRASGYDTDDESCKIRIHTLLAAYRNFNDTKCRITGTAPPKKTAMVWRNRCCLRRQTNNYASHLISSSGTGSDILTDRLLSLGNEAADDVNSLGNENVANEAICLISTFKNNPSSFYFKNNPNKKRSRSDMLFDR